ncbi:MAG: shikimate kinase [Aquificales bacterium]|nr:shikimate kinase [Aquificales bacterium]
MILWIRMIGLWRKTAVLSPTYFVKRVKPPFASGSERFRRQWERTVSLALAETAGKVIATGGRLMLDAENAAALMENGRVFCLTAEPEEIVARVEGGEKRPLLNVSDPARRVQQLLDQRQEAYGRFPQITTTDKTPEQVAQEIIDVIRDA